jgi:UDP-glucose-4-epimerase GalE
MRILVTGGAGYIGSFMVRMLLDKGNEVVVFDSLERGHKKALDPRANFVKGDIKDRPQLESFFNNGKFDALMHFAAYISVEESEKEPDKYYQNNVVGSKNLFESAINIGKIKNFIFSSSAAVYGSPRQIPIPEDHPKNPTSEYGRNKLAMEEILESLRKENPDVSFAALRYFNAAGAALDGSNGENHNPETHIIPLAIRAAIKSSEFKLYGINYNTPDGTCIRDYVHVLDLVEAHILALSKIQKEPGGYCYNVGTGRGHSNREVLYMVKRVSSKKISIKNEPRRAGDADQLVADPTKIRTELGFDPKYSDLETIVKTAWDWHAGRS